MGWYDVAMEITRAQALSFRADRHGFGTDGTGDISAPVLDLGVQDTGGPRAAQWALGVRGIDVDDADLVYAWTLRGAPHAYRRAEIAQVAAATAPYDEADAAKRIFDAAKPLKAAGIPVLDALATVADHMRDIVREPTVKGEVSTALTERLPEPYLRWCRPCQATHTYEQPFRIAALQAGLELTPGTSPPVLRRIAGWDGAAGRVPDHLDAVRACVRLLAPTTPRLVAEYLNAPVRTVRAHWPDDTIEVTLVDEARRVMADDVAALQDPPHDDRVRLLGAFDPWLQVRDRELLVADAAHRKDLWRVLGRPGALLRGAEIVGTWRPRSSGTKLRLQVEVWDSGTPTTAIEDEAQRLAAHRGQHFDGFVAP
jgi:hypothetical protein